MKLKNLIFLLYVPHPHLAHISSWTSIRRSEFKNAIDHHHDYVDKPLNAHCDRIWKSILQVPDIGIRVLDNSEASVFQYCLLSYCRALINIQEMGDSGISIIWRYLFEGIEGIIFFFWIYS